MIKSEQQKEVRVIITIPRPDKNNWINGSRCIEANAFVTLYEDEPWTISLDEDQDIIETTFTVKEEETK